MMVALSEVTVDLGLALNRLSKQAKSLSEMMFDVTTLDAWIFNFSDTFPPGS